MNNAASLEFSTIQAMKAERERLPHVKIKQWENRLKEKSM